MFKKKPIQQCSLCKRNRHNSCVSPNCMCLECVSTVEKQREKTLRIMNIPTRRRRGFDSTVADHKFGINGRAFTDGELRDYSDPDGFNDEDIKNY